MIRCLKEKLLPVFRCSSLASLYARCPARWIACRKGVRQITVNLLLRSFIVAKFAFLALFRALLSGPLAVHCQASPAWALFPNSASTG